MRLVIHMGATKTASTFLQRQLAINEELLAHNGIVIPKTGRRVERTANHHNVAWQLLGDRRYKEQFGTWDTLVDEIKSIDAPIVLLSSEGFARLAGEDDLRPKFAEAIAGAAEHVELMYVVREPLARINSMYAQSLKTFGGADRFNPYSRRAVKSGFYDLERAFSPWYDGDQVTFTALRFDEFVKVGPLASVLGSLGISVPRGSIEDPQGEVNVSPGPMAIEGMRLLQASIKISDRNFSRRSAETGAISKMAQRRADKNGWFEERFWGWDPERARAAADALAESNERFAQAVWGTEWPFTAPVNTASTAVNIADLKRRSRRELLDYVSLMVDKYLNLIRQRDRHRED